MNKTSQHSPRELTHFIFAIYIVLYILAFSVTIYRLTGVWAGDGTFQYGFLILPISLFLIWSHRETLKHIEFAPSLLGAFFVITSSLVWGLGFLVGVQLLEQLAVIALLPAGVLAIYGTGIARQLMFPLLYLFFAFPWPVDRLTVLLQNITAEFSVHVLQATGFVTYLHGVLIETPIATWHVADACSGIKFFLASLALGALYAHLFYRTWRRRMVFMALAFLVPILANGFRVYFTVVIGEVFGVRYASGTDHLIFGWQFFGTVLLLFFLAGWRFRQLSDPSTSSVLNNRINHRFIGGNTLIIQGLVVVFLIAGPTLAVISQHISSKPFVTSNETPQFGGWKLLMPDSNLLGARFRNATVDFMGTYLKGGAYVNLVDVYYAGRPAHGRKLLITGNRWYDPAQWRVLAVDGRQQLHIPNLWTVGMRVLGGNGQKRLVWYWYTVNGHPVINKLQLKWLQLLNSLSLHPLTTRLIVVSTPVIGGLQQAEDVLEQFVIAYNENSNGIRHPMNHVMAEG